MIDFLDWPTNTSKRCKPIAMPPKLRYLYAFGDRWFHRYLLAPDYTIQTSIGPCTEAITEFLAGKTYLPYDTTAAFDWLLPLAARVIAIKLGANLLAIVATGYNQRYFVVVANIDTEEEHGYYLAIEGAGA